MSFTHDELYECWRTFSIPQDILTRKENEENLNEKTMDGPAMQYPRNPAEGLPYAALSSDCGRHLAMLFDPSTASRLWQWQYVPDGDQPLTASPWQQMFYRLHFWSACTKQEDMCLFTANVLDWLLTNDEPQNMTASQLV
uniref:Uncharacterized protein n=1 Tax=Sciurus vulgaris TaxID=55149 RepID=A0A8D2CYW6_SCIVU